MLPKYPLNDLLPIRFRNGEQIRQFSKPCVRCGHMVHAKEMYGIVRLLDNHVGIAARACCPQCGQRFGVACVIDMEKRVRRVVIPAWLFGWYLRRLPLQAGEQLVTARESGQKTEPAVEPVQPSSAENIVRGDEIVGRYQGKPIPAWVLVDGRRLVFERIELGRNLAAHEFLLEGCLVYKG